MSFAEIAGQKEAVKILQDELTSERINHAYLFTGKDGVGKKSLSLQFARALLCQEIKNDSCDQCLTCQKTEHHNHPDLRVIDLEEDSKVIKIDQVRELQHELAYKPYEGGRKIYIIDNADKMTPEAANSLLKTLEEPPAYAVLILLAEEINQLLPTVISRCQLIKLSVISREIIEAYLKEEEADPEKARLFSLLAGGSLGRALTMYTDEDFLEMRSQVLDFLKNLPYQETSAIFECVKELLKIMEADFPFFNLISSWYRDIIICMQGNKDGIINHDYFQEINDQIEEYTVNELLEIIKLINKYNNYIERNVRPELTLQVLFLKIRAKRV